MVLLIALSCASNRADPASPWRAAGDHVVMVHHGVHGRLGPSGFVATGVGGARLAIGVGGIGSAAVVGDRAERRRDGLVEWWAPVAGGIEHGVDVLTPRDGIHLDVHVDGTVRGVFGGT